MTSGNERESMDAIYASGMSDFRTDFAPGQKVTGVVTAVSKNAVFVDIKAKSEGIIDRAELVEDGEFKVTEGDRIDAFFMGMRRGEIQLTVRAIGSNADDEDIYNAYASGIPIDGRVESEVNGGFEVRIGSQRGFCPVSQIDTFVAAEHSVYVGQRLTFMIVDYDESNVVVSRRKFLEQKAEESRRELREALHVGDRVDGVVKRLMPFGVFIDVGGFEGLVPISELAWNRVEAADEVVAEGDRISVVVLKLDWDNNRISFSRKQALGNPWETAGERFHETKCYTGTVMKLMDFGAFVQLEPGIEGLVHISKLGAGKRLNHPREVLKEGQTLEVFVESIDLERKRMSLTLENPQQGRTMAVGEDALTIGKTVTGVVDDIKPYGIFVRLTSARTGLLHISQIPLSGQVNKVKEMWKQYPPQSEIAVIIERIQEGKVSLSLPETKSENDEEIRGYLADDQSNEFGNLGSVFDGLGA